MKIKILLKDPDGIYDNLQEEIKDKKLREKVSNWFFQWGDYCELELDLDNMTGRVLTRPEWRN